MCGTGVSSCPPAPPHAHPGTCPIVLSRSERRPSEVTGITRAHTGPALRAPKRAPRGVRRGGFWGPGGGHATPTPTPGNTQPTCQRVKARGGLETTPACVRTASQKRPHDRGLLPGPCSKRRLPMGPARAVAPQTRPQETRDSGPRAGPDQPQAHRGWGSEGQASEAGTS